MSAPGLTVTGVICGFVAAAGFVEMRKPKG